LYCITEVKTGESNVNDASCVPRVPAIVIWMAELPTPAAEAHESVVADTQATVRQLVYPILTELDWDVDAKLRPVIVTDVDSEVGVLFGI
jgi:hypothetical protein